jgi:uncharacterized protein with HEPN domain
MTRHDDLVYLGHMLETALDAGQALKGVSYEQFLEDSNLKYALAHRVQIIGEAARRVSPSTQQAVQLPWAAMIGMRHKIVHDYMGIDFDLVWKTATDDLPNLVEVLRQIVPEAPSEGR